MKRIALTGAASGIGRETARRLAAGGHALLLIDRDEKGLEAVATELGDARVETEVADLADPGDLERMCARLEDAPDVLVNNAGIQNFAPVEELPPERVGLEFRVNVVAPIALCSAVIPGMRRRRSGHIVNLTSVFGSIGFAYFASYSSTKFAMRGFSEALRRELHGTGIHVSTVAPRAVRTPLSSQTQAMAEAVGMKMDPPERVAEAMLRLIDRPRPSRIVGFPESLFVRVNAWFPGLVDRALRKQNERTRPFAEQAALSIPGRRSGSTEWAA